jgi:hypothetical protein
VENHEQIGDSIASRLASQLATTTGVREATGAIPPDPSIDKEDESILRALAAEAPRLLTQDDIEAGTRPKVSRRTISKRIKPLLDAVFIVRPRGVKGGITLAPAGKAILERLDRAKLAR